ncbi:hypothetical protein [Streptomyces dysideae]|uniref:Uncharacterized protein n=1 Tax=Streptomyces dysideae TaxID=909626 RepID=A0A117S2E1_9ACTN|nr:hypothetical protein AQJ91_06910 [Streptomyces dysideae]
MGSRRSRRFSFREDDKTPHPQVKMYGAGGNDRVNGGGFPAEIWAAYMFGVTKTDAEFDLNTDQGAAVQPTWTPTQEPTTEEPTETPTTEEPTVEPTDKPTDDVTVDPATTNSNEKAPGGRSGAFSCVKYWASYRCQALVTFQRPQAQISLFATLPFQWPRQAATATSVPSAISKSRCRVVPAPPLLNHHWSFEPYCMCATTDSPFLTLSAMYRCSPYGLKVTPPPDLPLLSCCVQAVTLDPSA